MAVLPDESPATPPLLAVFIISAAALAYEVLLIRLFSIVHWHHFAFMVISIALLGYAASGSFITVFRHRLLTHYDSVFIGNIALFGLTSVACFMAVQLLPFNTLEILWDSSQWQRLLLSYLLLTLPFFFVANALALTIMRFPRHIALVYGVDLIGAGFGALSVMLLLQLLPADQVLPVIAVSGLAAGLFALRYAGKRLVFINATLLLCMLIIFMLPPQWLELRISQYKGLAQTLQIKDASLLWTHSSPVAQTDVVLSPLVPFRHAPGLSLQSPAGPPAQLAVFSDGDSMNVIDQVTDSSSMIYHDYLSSALPYHLQVSPQQVLILRSATGTDILQARLHGTENIDAVEPDAQLSRLITDEFADFYGWQQLAPHVTIHTIAPRGFSGGEKKYDLVIIGAGGGSSGGSAGVYELSTGYDYTVEALQSYLKLLADDGLLSLTLWTSNPARGNLKLFNTAVLAMRQSGITHPENNIAWIRSWNTATLLLKNSALTAAEISAVRDFSRLRSFDLAWLPDIRADEVNRFQLLQHPVFYLAADAMLNDPQQSFSKNYKYDIQPASDDRPYFDNYFRWSSFKEFLDMPGQSGIAMIGVGYPTLLVTLAQASVAAFVLILLPLLLIRSEKTSVDSRRLNIVLYFLSIGLAFLFIELAFIEKFTLILSQPLYAVAVTLCAFLVFSGAGSLYVQSQIKTATVTAPLISRLLRRAVFLIGLITILYIMLLPPLSNWLMLLPEMVKIICALVLAAPLAFFMGMPFPLGMATLQANSASLIPWAWGINGCASVLSAILAVLLAIEIGFNGVMLCAVVLYFIAWRNH